jgi:hypothetical protein
MKILTISREESRPDSAVTDFLTSAKLTKLTTTPAMVSPVQLDDVDCVVYIEQEPDSQVFNMLQECNCPSILVADQDFRGSRCLFIPFGILDRIDSMSIGINVIRRFIDSISTDSHKINFGIAPN